MLEQTDRGDCHEEPGGGAGDREDGALGKKLLHEVRARRTQRRPGRHLPGAAGRARERETCDIRARDEQHQADGTKQHQQHRPHAFRQAIAERDHRRRRVLIESRIGLHQAAGDIRDVLPRLRQANASLEPRHD